MTTFAGVLPPDGTSFPILQSAIAIGPTALTADTVANAGGATLTLVSVDSTTGALTLAISIPGLGVNNVQLTAGSGDVYQGTLANGSTIKVALGLQDYAAIGFWSIIPSGAAEATNIGFGVSGFTTPTSGMPTTGVAQYSGYTSGFVSVPQGSSHAEASLAGAASLSANFATGAITGSLTGIDVSPFAGGTVEPWDSVKISGTISGAAFSGATSVDATVQPASGAFLLNTSATGAINGEFFGPTAQDLGAVWTLYDGKATALGVIAAGPRTPPEGGGYLLTAPDAPTVGSNPPTTAGQGLELATTAGGPSFSSSPSAPAAGTVFAATETAMEVTPTFTVADDATTAAGLTETVSNYGTGVYELKIPNLGVDVDVTPLADTKLSNGDYIRLANLSPGGTPGLLDYVNFNQWTLFNSNDQLVLGTGVAMIGYQTPVGSMPTSGTATYSGVGNVDGVLFAAIAPGSLTGFTGDGSMTANFATGAVSGAFTNLVTHGGLSNSIWPSASFTGSISGDQFSGSTAANGAAGSITGGFYGPDANEVGAVWTLFGNQDAIGVFGAPQPAAPTVINALATPTIGPNAPTEANGIYTLSGGTTPLGTEFAFTQSAIAISQSNDSTTIGPDSATNSQGATLTTESGQAQLPSLLELKIPSLGIDLTFDPGSSPSAQASNGLSVGLQLNAQTYTLYGQWSVAPTQTGLPTNTSWFTAGFQTPVASMPVTGTATYAGLVEGSVYGPATTQGAYPAYAIGQLSNGVASLTANFASGAMSGTVSGMTEAPSGTIGPGAAWNNFSVSASISGATFAGTTAVTSTPASPSNLTMSAAASGAITGSFNGPSANELGAVWTLADGARSASGVIFGTKQTAPSDRRLKRDIEPVERLANGLQLYRYRYLGDDQLFVGVMAQDLLGDPRRASAVVRRDDGLLMVDYARLGLSLVDGDAMRRAGAAAIEIYTATQSLSV